MSISALRTCLLSISLFGLISGTCGFPNVEDTLALAWDRGCEGSEPLDFARGVATERLTDDEDHHLISEIGAGMSDKADIYRGHMTTQRTKMKISQEDASEHIREYHQKRIWMKMGRLFGNLQLGLSESGYNAFHPLLIEIWESLGEFSPKGDVEIKTTSEAEKLEIIPPEGGEQMKTDPEAEKHEVISLKGDEKMETTPEAKELGILSNILVRFERISAIGLDEKASNSHFRLSNIYSVIMNLSDTLVAHLAFSARYKSIRDGTLEMFLNDRKNLMITFNYFWGKFLNRGDTTSLCLNHYHGLEIGLRDIPFTEERQLPKQRNLESFPTFWFVIMNLSDTLVAHLAFSARYKSIRDGTLEMFLNDRKNLMITFNYFWGKFLNRGDTTSLCLNHYHGLEIGLRDIPFTEDMQGYFKFLNDDTRADLSRIKIAMEMLKLKTSKSGPTRDYDFDVLFLAKEFIHITSTRINPSVTPSLRFYIETTHSILALKIFKKIVELSNEYDGDSNLLPGAIKCSSVLIQALSFLKGKIRAESWEEHKIAFHDRENVDDLEAAIQKFTSALKLVYSKYVRTIQDEALNLAVDESRTKYIPTLSYLTPIFTKEEVSNYHMKLTASDNKLCAKIIQQTHFILAELEKVEESGSRSIKQLYADKIKID
ncbi:hypothetical protein PSTT_15969 [Puccinia striiformis]|uniref:Uncharacterized protein n=1 Tax=Puccinia striiformis TaxID=27350 RepID=A0A2S4UF18_9BASI|nr:hypothetical protein PSTT_15969 [Puccinia striiformis]